jgi:cysteine synthase A
VLEGNGGGHGQASLTREPPRAGEVREIVAGVRPELLDESFLDDVVLVFGGSTGTVVSGAMNWLARHDGRDVTAVTIAPDLGERYLDTLYQSNWIEDLYGKDALPLGTGVEAGPAVLEPRSPAYRSSVSSDLC